MQTGLGRTGKLFAAEHWGLEPDLMPVAKSLSGGYVPVGALLMSDTVYEAVFDSLEHAFSHGSTFAPNDYAMVAGLATLRELDDRDLVDASARLGELLLERTRPLVERYEVVKEVRGLGLMWAIEFGEPDRGRTTWRMLEKMQPGIFAQLVVVPLFTDHRILSQVAGHRVNIVKGLPPLDDHRGGRRLVRDRARPGRRRGAEDGQVDDELRAARGAGGPEAARGRALTLSRLPAEEPHRKDKAGQPPRGDDRDLLPVVPDRLVKQDDVAHQPDEVGEREDLRDHLEEVWKGLR